jgi:hypothetical protein
VTVIFYGFSCKGCHVQFPGVCTLKKLIEMRGKVPGAFQTDTLKSKCDQNTNFSLFYYWLPEKNSRWGKLIKNYTGSSCNAENSRQNRLQLLKENC